MLTAELIPERASARRSAHWIPAAIALLSLAPLVWCWPDFRAMFWFGDEWDQLDHIARQGFWSWVALPFGENVAPVFKLSWGGLALASGGSYAFMLVAVWCVHLAAIVLLGCWLLQAGFGAVATAAVLLVFGLTETNLETLGWSIQLITVQGMTLFIAAGLMHEACERRGRWTPLAILSLGGLVTLSTFSFARGPLVGLTLATVTLIPLATSPAARGEWRTKLAVALACLLPAAVSITVVALYAPGNHHHLAAAGLRAPALFAAAYFFLNPFYNFTAVWGWSEHTILIFGAAKLAVLVLGWALAGPSQRRLLLTVLIFDLGNAVLLGVGRYNELLLTATSSRYQYVPLICTLPFAGAIVEFLVGRITPRALRSALAALVLSVLAWFAFRPWPREFSGWADWRGRQARELLFRNPNPPADGAIPGIPFLQTIRAKELVTRYNLH